MRSKLYTCVFPQKMQNLSICQSGSWHILNRMKRDPSRIPVYSDRDPASQPGIPAGSSGIPIGIPVYSARIYSGSHFFFRESWYIPIKIPPYPSGIPVYFDRYLYWDPTSQLGFPKFYPIGIKWDSDWNPIGIPAGIPYSFSLGKLVVKTLLLFFAYVLKQLYFNMFILYMPPVGP